MNRRTVGLLAASLTLAGCGDTEGACQVVSSNLSPPDPLLDAP